MKFLQFLFEKRIAEKENRGLHLSELLFIEEPVRMHSRRICKLFVQIIKWNLPFSNLDSYGKLKYRREKESVYILIQFLIRTFRARIFIILRLTFSSSFCDNYF